MGDLHSGTIHSETLGNEDSHDNSRGIKNIVKNIVEQMSDAKSEKSRVRTYSEEVVSIKNSRVLYTFQKDLTRMDYLIVNCGYEKRLRNNMSALIGAGGTFICMIVPSNIPDSVTVIKPINARDITNVNQMINHICMLKVTGLVYKCDRIESAMKILSELMKLNHCKCFSFETMSELKMHGNKSGKMILMCSFNTK